MLTSFQKNWGVEQWVVFLKDKEIPILPRSRQLLLAEIDSLGDALAPKDMVNLVFGDPFLALKLLRRAEGHRSSTLAHETTTALGSVLQAGFDEIIRTVKTSILADDTDSGLNDCEFRSVIAASIGRHWAAAHADISAEEIAMAALLSESAEMLLWHFAPELPRHSLEELESGRATRTTQAQQQACGFTFKQMTLALTEAWQLPHLITLLIRGSDSLRAKVARIATDTARHIVADPQNPAIPADIVAIQELLPGVSLSHLIAPLPISDEYAAVVLARITEGEVSQLSPSSSAFDASADLHDHQPAHPPGHRD
jgi:hypothetical protein